jgi:hypothetical protein
MKKIGDETASSPKSLHESILDLGLPLPAAFSAACTLHKIKCYKNQILQVL